MSTSVKAKFNSRRGSVEANLPVLFFEDNGVSIVHCPALDLSGYGKTEDEARRSFEVVLEEFFDYTLEKSTLAKVLNKLGWNSKDLVQSALLVIALLFLSPAYVAYSQGFTHEESVRKIQLSHVVDLSKAEPSTITSENFEIPEPGSHKAIEAIKANLHKLRAERGISAVNPTSGAVPVLARNFQANPISGTPNDNSMAISNAGIVVSVANTNVKVYDDTGKQLLSRSLALFASSLGTLTRTYDPRAIYDPISDRFIVIFLVGTTHDVNNPIVCFSQTNDPTGIWNCYKLPGNPLPGDTTWSDYPIVSISKDELFITFNLLKDNTDWRIGFTRSIIWQIEKQDGYDSTALDTKLYSEIKYDGRHVWSICPVHGSEQLQSPNMYFLSVRPDAEQNDTVFLHEVTNTIASGNSTLAQKVMVSNVKYGVAPEADQPFLDDGANSKRHYLSTNDARVLDATYRNGEIHFAGNTVDMSNLRAGIYIGKINDLASPTPQIAAQIYSDPNLDFGYPSIVAVPAGLLMTFLHSSVAVAPGNSAAYMTSFGSYIDRIVVKEGNTWINLLPDSVERWGDYTGLQVRYDDPSSAWVSCSYGNLLGNTHRHETWIGEVRIATGDVAAPKLELARSLTYPNPSGGIVHLSAKSGTVRSVSYTNTNGKRVDASPLDTSDGLSLDLSDQPNGVYHITLHYSDGSQETQKIVLDR
jgi:hypothetical protein